jgi:hypothetical protein
MEFILYLSGGIYIKKIIMIGKERITGGGPNTISCAYREK